MILITQILLGVTALASAFAAGVTYKSDGVSLFVYCYAIINMTMVIILGQNK